MLVQLIAILALCITTMYLQYDTSNLNVKQWYSDWCSIKLVAVDNQDRQRAKDIQELYSDSELQKTVYKYMDDKQIDNDKVVNQTSQYVAPWIVFLILSVIAWVTFSIFLLFDKKCPPCKRFQRDYLRDPLSKRELFIPSCAAIFFNIIIGSVCIVGIMYGSQIANGLNNAKCEFMGLYYDLLYYNSINGFTGLYNVTQSLGTLNQSIQDFQFDTIGTYQDQISNSTNQSLIAFNQTHYLYKRDQLQSPLPILSTTNGIDFTIPYESYLSASLIYDYLLSYNNETHYNITKSTYQNLSVTNLQYLNITPQIDYILDYYTSQINCQQQLELTSIPITTVQFATAVNNGLSQSQSAVTQLEQSSKDIYDLIYPVGNFSNSVSDFQYAAYCLVLITTLSSIAAILVIQFQEKYKFRIFVHSTWFIYCLFMILGFILGGIVHPSTAVTAQACQYLDTYINNETFYNKSTLINNTNAQNVLYQCFYTKSGNIFNAFNMSDAALFMSAYSSALRKFNTLYVSNLIKGVTVQQLLQSNRQAINNIATGTVIDLQDSKNLQILQNTFNNITGVGCVEIQSVSCNGTGNGGFNNPTQAGSLSITTCWHPSYMLTQTGSCPSQGQYFQQLKTFYQNQKDSWQIAITDLDNLILMNSQIYSALTQQSDKIRQYELRQNQSLYALSQISNGTNCTFIKNQFQKIHDGLCVLFLPAIYRTTILIILLSFALFFGSILNCCYGFRIARVEEFGVTQTKILPYEAVKETGQMKGQSEILEDQYIDIFL
ncbi:hypothetical protein pb186bvf_003308 [Paramecium bursaria]